MRFSSLRRVTLSCTMAAALAVSGASFAQAATPQSATASASTQAAGDLTISSAQATSITDAQVAQAFKELASSSLPRTTKTVDGVRQTTFNLNGTNFTFTGYSTGIQPQIGGGSDSKGVYVSFNTKEQKAIAAGGAAAIAGAICLIPAVGPVACVVAGAIVAAAAVYLSDSGICSNNRNLRVYAKSPFYARCV